jgi:hypothetical protein
MTSISVPARVYRGSTLRIVKPEELSTFVRPFSRRRRTLRSLREQGRYDQLYIRHQIV